MGEAAGSSVKAVLVTVDELHSKEQDFWGTCLQIRDMGKHATWKAWLKLELPMCFEMLYESDIWSGDSSASSHSTSSKMDAVNKRQLEVEGNYTTIHASGQFMT